MRRLMLGVALFAAALSVGCAEKSTTSAAAPATAAAAPAAAAAAPAMASVTSLASDPMVSGLMSGLGLNATQAVGGAGALLGLAQENLAAPDFAKVAGAIPGASSMIAQAKTLGGITGKFGSLADLGGAFSKMGLSADQVKSLTPALTDAVSKAAGPDVGALLAGAIK